jgi:predicted transcriptional regulator
MPEAADKRVRSELKKKLEELASDTMIGFRVRSALKEKLEELAKADHRSLSGYIVHLLETHVAEKLTEGKRGR